MSRLDAELVLREVARSRERAKEMIKNGSVTVNGKKITKPSAEVCAEDKIESADSELYVGRGALKLEKAAEKFRLDFKNKICLDIGASTGGFTDFMLQCGAVKVFAVDVGHGQLARSLCEDKRVINMEETDIRNVNAEILGAKPDFICGDVSFISLKMILPKVYELLKEEACAAMLIKPQFEAGRSNIGKHGIVKDRKVHEKILEEIDIFAVSLGFYAEMYTYSPIKGGSGNIEYLVKLIKTKKEPEIHNFKKLTEEAFKQL